MIGPPLRKLSIRKFVQPAFAGAAGAAEGDGPAALNVAETAGLGIVPGTPGDMPGETPGDIPGDMPGAPTAGDGMTPGAAGEVTAPGTPGDVTAPGTPGDVATPGGGGTTGCAGVVPAAGGGGGGGGFWAAAWNVIAAIAATTVTVRIVFISLVIETGLKIKGPIYPKLNRQESSKTFHKSLGRKITIELSRRVGCSASALSSFYFLLIRSHFALDSATATSRRSAPPIRRRHESDRLLMAYRLE